MSGNDEKRLAQLTAADIPWVLPPVDRLMFDDETTWLADSLRVAIEQLQAMTIQADRQSARIVSLIAELRTARAEAQALGAQVRYLQNIAA